MSDDHVLDAGGIEETRARLRQLIDAWAAGAIDEWAVRGEAEVIALAIPWDELKVDARISVYEVADGLLSSPFYGAAAASELAYPTRRPRW